VGDDSEYTTTTPETRSGRPIAQLDMPAKISAHQFDALAEISVLVSAALN
jgi:hypothetical protein